MKSYRSYRRLNPKESEVYQYLTHWFYVTIREMTSLRDFRPDPEWIRGQLRYDVDLKSIKEALTFLIENRFLEIKADGSIIPPVKNLECMGGIYRIALTQYHRELLDLAKQSISDTPSEERSILGHTLRLDPAQFEAAKQIIVKAMEDVRDLEKTSKSNELVYHLELALFPLTRRSS